MIHLSDEKLKEFRDVLELVFVVIRELNAAQEDGKIDLKDIGHVGPVFSALLAAIKGFNNIPDSFATISDEDKADLVAYFKDKFDLPNDNTEAVVEEVFELVLNMVATAVRVKALLG